MPEAPKKDEAPNIGVKPVSPKAVALNVKDPATGTKTTGRYKFCPQDHLRGRKERRKGVWLHGTGQ